MNPLHQIPTNKALIALQPVSARVRERARDRARLKQKHKHKIKIKIKQERKQGKERKVKHRVFSYLPLLTTAQKNRRVFADCPASNNITLTARSIWGRPLSLEQATSHRRHSPHKEEHNTYPYCCEGCPKSSFCLQKFFKALGNSQGDADSETDQDDNAFRTNQAVEERPKRDDEDKPQSNYAYSFDETHHVTNLRSETRNFNTWHHSDCAGVLGEHGKPVFRVNQSDSQSLTLLTALICQQTARIRVGKRPEGKGGEILKPMTVLHSAPNSFLLHALQHLRVVGGGHVQAKKRRGYPTRPPDCFLSPHNSVLGVQQFFLFSLRKSHYERH